MVSWFYTGRRSRRCRPVSMLAMVLTVCALEVRAAETVESLRYGASLYHFYQNDYFEALTELMVGQSEEDLGPHAAGAELLRGGMSLSYGMDLQAESIFQVQLDSAPEHVDRSGAWFYLGKVAWQRGERARALAALAAMETGYEGELTEEARYLRASAQLGAGDSEQAMELLYALPKKSKWRYYLHYNAAAWFAEQEQWAAASEHFERFDEMPRDTAETLALFERAQTAAGYAYLAADKPAAARESFEKIGLNGVAAEKALLGFGWAAVREGDYLAALSAWKPLTAKSMLSASARESLLAVPYAYEALDRPAVALLQYEQASEQYQAQLNSLQSAIVAFENEPVAQLLGMSEADSDAQSGMSWVYANDILPEGDYAAYLQYLVTRHGFQVALRELRDLYDMRRRLQGAQERLAVLREVDSHQQAVWSDVLSRDTQHQLASRAHRVEQDYQALNERVAMAVRNRDGRALADEQGQARWARFDRALAAARALERTEQIDRLLFLKGLMQWEDSEAFPARHWQARKNLSQLSELLLTTQQSLQQLETAIAQRGVATFQPRIQSLDVSVASHLERVNGVLEQSEEGVRQLAVAALREQGEQLRRALGQSGLAIARLYDSAARRGAIQ